MCVEKEEKIVSIERELERLRVKVAAGERDIRRTLKPLKEVCVMNRLSCTKFFSIFLFF